MGDSGAGDCDGDGGHCCGGDCGGDGDCVGGDCDAVGCVGCDVDCGPGDCSRGYGKSSSGPVPDVTAS